MDSPLQIISGDIRHAILTTYSINLAFLERWVIRMLRDAGVTNIVVLADHAQLGEALTDSRPPRAAGRDYHLVATRLGPGAFHPKIIYLAGTDHAKACVSSANLTVDGQLRNVEAGVVLESDQHPRALADLAGFLTAIATGAPPHVRAAIDEATRSTFPTGTEDEDASVLHNLDTPIIEQLPETSSITYYTAFADHGAAAAALTKQAERVNVVIDAKHFDATPAFLDGEWSIDPRDFGKRRLHGKVITDVREPWTVVGSPNLSARALQRTADTGNTELAVLLHRTAIESAGEPWEGDHSTLIADAASAAANQPPVPLVRAFNAWVEGSKLHAAGVPDGATVEFAVGATWTALGELRNGTVELPPRNEVYRVRAWHDGIEYRALVHDPSKLAARRHRTAAAQRASQMLSSLPLERRDLDELSSIIEQLGELAHEVSAPTNSAGAGNSEDAAPITEWIPADPQGMPTILPLILDAWNGDIDTFRALVRHALRLEPDPTAPTSDELHDGFEHEPDENAAETELDDDSDAALPQATRRILNRYRKDFVHLVQRAAVWVRDTEHDNVAALIYQTILRLHEQLASTHVLVDDVDEVLVDETDLLQPKWMLIEAYLRRSERDPACIATSIHHLATCLANEEAWEPLDWAAIKARAAELAPMVFELPESMPAASRELIDTAELRRAFESYRSSWQPVVDEAEGHLLGDFRSGAHPFHFVAGDLRFERPDESEAWQLVALASRFAFATNNQVAIIAWNRHPKSIALAHVIVLNPAGRTLADAFLRRTDNQWATRSYGPATADLLDAIRSQGVHAVIRRRRFDADVPSTDRAKLDEAIALVDELERDRRGQI